MKDTLQIPRTLAIRMIEILDGLYYTAEPVEQTAVRKELRAALQAQPTPPVGQAAAEPVGKQDPGCYHSNGGHMPDRTAWLIEVNQGIAPAPIWLAHYLGDDYFTTDANTAIHFPTERSAKEVLDALFDYRRKNTALGFAYKAYRVTEHIFMGSRTTPQPTPVAEGPVYSKINWLPHDDSLRFAQRVLESDAPKKDRDDAAQMIRDLRRSVYTAQPTPDAEAIRLALGALRLPCDRWNKQQTAIVNAAIAALENVVK